MSHDVFISHSSLDKLAADAICHGLEAKGIRCWIAPRDQIAGMAYGEQITEAIEAAHVMVLVFSDNVNKSQAVLNEINIAAGADVTIVPFRIASVEFNPELHFYLGRVHWLDAFPQPIDSYIDALATTIRRNLPHTDPPPAPTAETAASVAGAAAAAAPPPAQPEPPPAPPPPAPPPPPPPPIVPPPQTLTVTGPKPPPTNYKPLMITGGVFAAVVLIALVASLFHGPGPTNAASNAALNNAAVAAVASNNNNGNVATPPPAPQAAGSGGPTGDGSELNPTGQTNAAGVNYYETVVTANGPPAALQGATVINTAQLVANMRTRDAGTNPFWLIDARGCTAEPTIPTSICLSPDTLAELEAKVPDKEAQLVVFCHDGTCPMSYEMAYQALAAGYLNVFWYRGGINAWMAAGLPSVTQASATAQ